MSDCDNREVAKNLIRQCIEEKRKKVLIIFDETVEDIVPFFEKALDELGKKTSTTKLDIGNCHGEEPGESVYGEMLRSDAIMCMTKYSLAHTNARRLANEKGIPFLSMPDYSESILSNTAFLVDYSSRVSVVKRYADALSKGERVRILSEIGTDLLLDISGRKGNPCAGCTSENMLLGSPPDIEANVAPVETFTTGKIVVDGSITDDRLGLLENPVTLTVTNGAVSNVECCEEKTKKTVEKIFDDVHDDKARVIGELGLGFNDCAMLCGNMLVDEGAQGCIHIGIGSNWTIGGANKVGFHLDFVIRDATVYVDDIKIIDRGRIVYESDEIVWG